MAICIICSYPLEGKYYRKILLSLVNSVSRKAIYLQANCTLPSLLAIRFNLLELVLVTADELLFLILIEFTRFRIN